MPPLKQPDPWQFIEAIFSDWGARLSGTPSVIFTIIAFLVDSNRQKIVFGVLAAISLILSAYFVWASERKGRVQLLNIENAPEVELEYFFKPTNEVHGTVGTPRGTPPMAYNRRGGTAYHIRMDPIEHLGAKIRCLGEIDILGEGDKKALQVVSDNLSPLFARDLYTILDNDVFTSLEEMHDKNYETQCQIRLRYEDKFQTHYVVHYSIRRNELKRETYIRFEKRSVGES